MRVTRTEGPARRVILGAALQLGQLTGRVGWFEGARYPDGTPVAAVAMVQEFGSTKMKIPARPSMRPTADASEPAWKAYSAQLAKGVMQGRITPEGLFEALALMAEGDVRKTFIGINEPELSERTKADRRRRGKVNMKPLQDSGLMLASLTSQVSKE